MLLTKTDSSQRIVAELNRIFKDFALQLENKDLRKLVTVLTTLDIEDYDLQIPLKHMDILILTATSWYVEDKFLRGTIQNAIREKIRKRDIVLQERVEILLTDRIHAILYILDSCVLGRTPNEVFGNLLAPDRRVGIKARVLRSSKPKELVFRRGYRDKGSRVLDNHGRNEILKDAYIKEKQILAEADLDERPDRIKIYLGYLGCSGD